MDNKIKNIIIFFSVVFFTTVFFSSNALANGLSITVEKECDIEYMGENCVVEMTVENTSGNVLDGEAIFYADFEGSAFDGIGITPYFSIKNSGWLSFGDWSGGNTSTGEKAFIIEEGESSAELKINTHPALYPGNYDFSLKLIGTYEDEEEEEEEYTTTTTVGGGGGGGTTTTEEETTEEETTEEEATEEEETEQGTTEEEPPGQVAGEQTERQEQTGVGGYEPQKPYTPGQVKGADDKKEDTTQDSQEEQESVDKNKQELDTKDSKTFLAQISEFISGLNKWIILLIAALIAFGLFLARKFRRKNKYSNLK